MTEPQPIETAPHDQPIFVFVPPHWHTDVAWFDTPPMRGRGAGWYQDGWREVFPTQWVARNLEYEALLKEASYGRKAA